MRVVWGDQTLLVQGSIGEPGVLVFPFAGQNTRGCATLADDWQSVPAIWRHLSL